MGLDDLWRLVIGLEKNGECLDMIGLRFFNCFGRRWLFVPLGWLFVQMLLVPGALGLDKVDGAKGSDGKGKGGSARAGAGAIEGGKKAAESLEREKYVYLIQNDGKNQVTKVKWQEGLNVGQVFLEHHSYEWRLVIELWRGDQRKSYKRQWVTVFEHRLVDKDVIIIGPLDVERRAIIEALPEIKALGLPRDKRKHWDGKF
jgi:hypothetical protein